MADLRKDAVSMLQSPPHNEKRLEEEATLKKNNVAIKDFNKKIEEWKLHNTFELASHNLMFINSKPPYPTIDLSTLIQSLTELGNLTLLTNQQSLLTNDAAAIAVSVWQRSRDAVNAFILNYALVNKDTQKHVDALNETLKATIHVAKNPQEIGAVKTLLEKNNALFAAVETNPLLRKVRAPLYANKIAKVFEKICQLAMCITFGAAIMFCLTCLAPTISIKFATLCITAFGTSLASAAFANLFTGKRPLPEINELRRAEDSFAKAVSPKEYHAFKGTKAAPATSAFSFSGLFKKAAPKPAAPVEVKVSAAPVKA